MILQRGLGCLPLWQQSIFPLMDFMEQAGADCILSQTPQGVRATNTPRVKKNRLKNRMVFRMDESYT